MFGPPCFRTMNSVHFEADKPESALPLDQKKSRFEQAAVVRLDQRDCLVSRRTARTSCHQGCACDEVEFEELTLTGCFAVLASSAARALG